MKFRIKGNALERNNEVDLSELQEQRRKSNKSLYCEAKIKRKLEYWTIRLKCIKAPKKKGENWKLEIHGSFQQQGKGRGNNAELKRNRMKRKKERTGTRTEEKAEGCRKET